MSCPECEAVQDRGDVAYLRVGKANVGLVGCDEHLNQMMGVNQVGVRVLGSPNTDKKDTA